MSNRQQPRRPDGRLTAPSGFPKPYGSLSGRHPETARTQASLSLIMMKCWELLSSFIFSSSCHASSINCLCSKCISPHYLVLSFDCASLILIVNDSVALCHWAGRVSYQIRLKIVLPCFFFFAFDAASLAMSLISSQTQLHAFTLDNPEEKQERHQHGNTLVSIRLLPYIIIRNLYILYDSAGYIWHHKSGK